MRSEVLSTACGVILLVSCAGCTAPRAAADGSAAMESFANIGGQCTRPVAQFAADANALLAEVALLKNHPAWPEMAGILNAYPSIQHLEGQDEAAWKTKASIAQWEQRWRVSSQVILGNHSQLVQRTNALEQRRVVLMDACKAAYNGAAALFLSEALRQSYPAAWISLSDSMYKNRDLIESLLNLYRIDSWGLYYRLPFRSDGPNPQ